MRQVNWQRAYYILMCTICIGILLWAGWSLLSQFVYAIVILLLSMAVAFLLTPPVNLLEKYHVPRLPAAILVYIVMIGTLVTFGYALVSSLINQVQYFSNNLPEYIFQLPTTYLIQLLEGNVLAPRILGHAVGLHPIASILTFIVGMRLFGAFGALLATPVVAAAWVVIASLYRSLRGKTADSIPAEKHSPSIRPRLTPGQWKDKSIDMVESEKEKETTTIT